MIAELLTTGFGYHDTQSERLADELETVTMEPVDAVHWVRLLHISNHTIGEHLGDWDRAQRLAERVLDGRTANAETSPAWARLATARFLAGDVLGSIAAEIEALRAASDIRGGYIDAKISLAVGL